MRCFGIAVAGALLLPAAAPGQARDTVEVLSVTPATPLVLGMPTELRVRCRILLRSTNRGEAWFGLNDRAPHDVSMVAKVSLVRPVTDTVLTLRVVPVQWGASEPYYLMAAVGSAPSAGSWYPTSRTRRTIAFRADSSPVMPRDVGAELRTHRMAVSAAGDSLHVEVRHAATLRRGVPTDVDVNIDTNLRSIDGATVRVLANQADHLRYQPSSEYHADHGGVRRSLRVTLIPVDYAEQGVYALMVSVVPTPRDTAEVPRALLRVLIPFVVTP